jgi:hypothetical protein
MVGWLTKFQSVATRLTPRVAGSLANIAIVDQTALAHSYTPTGPVIAEKFATGLHFFPVIGRDRIRRTPLRCCAARCVELYRPTL